MFDDGVQSKLTSPRALARMPLPIVLNRHNIIMTTKPLEASKQRLRPLAATGLTIRLDQSGRLSMVSCVSLPVSSSLFGYPAVPLYIRPGYKCSTPTPNPPLLPSPTVTLYTYSTQTLTHSTLANMFFATLKPSLLEPPRMLDLDPSWLPHGLLTGATQ